MTCQNVFCEKRPIVEGSRCGTKICNVLILCEMKFNVCNSIKCIKSFAILSVVWVINVFEGTGLSLGKSLVKYHHDRHLRVVVSMEVLKTSGLVS